MAIRKLILQVLLFVIVFTMIATHQSWGEKDCYGEKEKVKSRCRESIAIEDDIPPDHECCKAVKESDMICVCRILRIDEETNISAVKLVHVAKTCGKPVPVGNKCGSM